MLFIIISALTTIHAQKSNTSVITIGVALPFTTYAQQSMYYRGNLPSIQTIFALRQTVLDINNDPNILPNITLQLQILDSQGDSYGALSAGAILSKENTISANIGELFPENTVSFALPFQYGSQLHCVPVTTPTTHSNKYDYPTLYRTGNTAQQVAFAMIDLLNSFSVQSCAMIVSTSNYGGYHNF